MYSSVETLVIQDVVTDNSKLQYPCLTLYSWSVCDCYDMKLNFYLFLWLFSLLLSPKALHDKVERILEKWKIERIYLFIYFPLVCVIVKIEIFFPSIAW